MALNFFIRWGQPFLSIPSLSSGSLRLPLCVSDSHHWWPLPMAAGSCCAPQGRGWVRWVRTLHYKQNFIAAPLPFPHPYPSHPYPSKAEGCDGCGCTRTLRTLLFWGLVGAAGVRGGCRCAPWPKTDPLRLGVVEPAPPARATHTHTPACVPRGP